MSKTFCPLPWTHLATHPHGSISLCCESNMENREAESQNLPKEFVTLHNSNYNFESIMNSDLFKQVRKDMLEGKQPRPCANCYKIEALGNESKRTREINLLDFSLIDAQRITHADGTLAEVDFEFIELRLGNICNLACRSCNPASSSRWIKDWEIMNNQKYEMPQNMFEWPLDQSFWSSLLPHCNKTRRIYINGGEPLLVDKHLNFLESLIDNNVSKNIELVYSTNSTVINENYVDVWKCFKSVEFMISIDCLEDRNSYLRHPSKWDNTIQSLDWLTSLGHTAKILQTVSIMNIYYIKEFWEFFSNKKIEVCQNPLIYPDYYNAANLPLKIKKLVLDKIIDIPPAYNKMKNFLAQEDNEENFEKFFSVTDKLDSIRKQSFKDTFSEWYKILQER